MSTQFREIIAIYLPKPCDPAIRFGTPACRLKVRSANFANLAMATSLEGLQNEWTLKERLPYVY